MEGNNQAYQQPTLAFNFYKVIQHWCQKLKASSHLCCPIYMLHRYLRLIQSNGSKAFRHGKFPFFLIPPPPTRNIGSVYFFDDPPPSPSRPLACLCTFSTVRWLRMGAKSAEIASQQTTLCGTKKLLLIFFDDLPKKGLGWWKPTDDLPAEKRKEKENCQKLCSESSHRDIKRELGAFCKPTCSRMSLKQKRFLSNEHFYTIKTRTRN